jgi:hypothetical protein
MGRENRGGVQVIHGNIEEPLELMLVKIHTQHPVRSRFHDHVSEQLCAYRDSWLVLSVLPRVTIVRHHACNAGRRRAPRRINQEQKLENVFGGWIGRLHNEHIVPANILVDPDEDLAIGKARDSAFCQIDAQAAGDLIGKRSVRGSRQQLQPASRDYQLVHC